MSDTRFPRRFGRYILLDRINSGGMAEVFRAKVMGLERFERLVAIKCMLPALAEDAQFTTMFIDEAKLAAQLNHPNVVQIYELGRHEEQLYIAMELVAGRDLRHVIKTASRQKKKLSVAFAAYAIAKAAEGLDFAHRKAGMDGTPLNLVHRDVSPQNILVSYEGDIKVVDFGIAKAEERATATQAGVLKGKFAYMAPEQAMGGAVDRRADIFALGVTLYEVLSGGKLFQGESDLSILDKVRKAELPNLKAIVPEAPDELQDVLNKALARNPDERFSWGSELAEALEPFLIDERTIFGAKRAGTILADLYAEEIQTWAEKQKGYAKVTVEDVEASAASRVAQAKTQVFESSFGGDQAVMPAPTGGKTAVMAPTEKRPAVRPSDWDVRTSEEPVPPEAHGGQRSGQDGWMHSPTEAFQLPTGQSKVTQKSNVKTSLRDDDDYDRPRQRSSMSPLVIGGIAISAIITLTAVVVVVLYSRAPGQPIFGQLAPQVVGPGGTPPPVMPTPVPNPTPENVPVGTPPPAGPAPKPVVIGGAPAPAPAPTPAPTPKSQKPPKTASVSKPAPPKEDDKGYGYLSLMVVGVSAKVFVDGAPLGYSPLLGVKVKAGKHRLRIVDEKGNREKSEELVISSKDTKKTPKKLTLRFD